MNDLISRQATIAWFSCCELTPDGGIDVNDAIQFLEQLPSAQPEIVRCKDCKYADPFGHCDYVNFWNGVTDFCSRAERRTDEKENI